MWTLRGGRVTRRRVRVQRGGSRRRKSLKRREFEQKGCRRRESSKKEERRERSEKEYSQPKVNPTPPTNIYSDKYP